MKKIFPLIVVLITLSLVGLIFFQYLWLKSARDIKEQQLMMNATRAVGNAGDKMMEDKPLIPVQKKSNDLLFPTERMKMDLYNTSITQRFTKEEIAQYIRNAFNQNMLKDVPFEFAISSPSMASESVMSNNFMKYYVDTARNFQFVYPLFSASGTQFESMDREEVLAVIVPNQDSIVMKKISWFIVGAVLFTLIIITAFFLTIRTLIRQKKLSEIKNDFINNMTHEFKTPLATISLAVDALKNEKVLNDDDKRNYYTGIIKEENKRMNQQVETILQAALLDKKEVHLNLKKFNANDLIMRAVNNMELPISQKEGKIITDLHSDGVEILADEVHFINLINSLLDNAVKYCKENVPPIVKVSTSKKNDQLLIKIEDNGLGMSKETSSKIFEKFYRAHTGNVHNVKGFGLGLTYVKTMIEAHKGNVSVDSTLGKGTTFSITIPQAV